MVRAFQSKVSHVRTGIVIVGVILLVLGAVLAFVPLVTQSVQQTGSSSSSGFSGYVWNNNGIVLPATVKISWSASSTVMFLYITCTNTITQSQAQAANFNISSCNGMQSYGAQSSTFLGQTIHYDTGTSGSQSISVPAGGTLLFSGGSGSPTTINISASYPEPLIGFILLIVGVLILLVGLVLKSKKRAAAAPPQAWGPGQPGAGPAVQPGPPGQWQQPPQ